MSNDVTANNRTIVHKGDGLVNVAAAPDVCKTPTPAGPTPVPYVNVARNSDLAQAAKRVKIHGSAVAHEGSRLSRSAGDEPGTLGGVISNTNRGKMTWGSSSPNVLVEGKAVVRFLDVCNHNNNTHNTIHAENGEVIVFINYGDDTNLCRACGTTLPEDGHVVLPDNKGDVAAIADQLFNKLEELGESLNYMIAVVRCGLCDGIFAAHSGNATRFGAACDALGLQHSGGDSAAQATAVKDLVQKRHKERTPMVAAMTGNQQGKYLKQFIQGFTKKLRETPRGAGGCAGPRALTLALSGKHQPIALCEKLYQPAVPEFPTTQDNIYREAWPTSASEEPKTKTFAHGSRVPSCSVCSELIPALLCGTKGSCTKGQP